MEVRHPNREEIHPYREEYILIGNETSGKGTKHPDREEYILIRNETSGKGTNHPDREEYIMEGENKY